MLQSGPQVFERIFRHLIANPRSPFIIHCTAGKDRTGVFIMLLLGLCGVDDEVIAREYELTNLGYWGKIDSSKAKSWKYAIFTTASY